MRRKVFRDRADAGRRLAAELAWLRDQDVVVLALPRGGVPVALEVAAALQAPIDVVAVRKMDLPGRLDLAMGAVGEGGVEVLLDEVVRVAAVPRLLLAQAQHHAREELEEQITAYRDVAPDLPLAGRVALLVDDGTVTGATMRAACRVARARNAGRVVVATPVAAPEVLVVLEEEADVVRALYAPSDFNALEDWYDDLAPVTDEQVRALLAQATGLTLETIDLTAVDGALTPVPHARGLVVLAGDGLAGTAVALRAEGWTTLRLDLAETGYSAVDRLVAATRGALAHPPCTGLPVGWVGTGDAVRTLLEAAAELGAPVQAIVGRGGRPDLARAVLPNVAAPTLLLAAARNRRGVEHARMALSWTRSNSDLKVVPGASESFDDPASEEVIAECTASWLAAHLAPMALKHQV